MTSEEAAFRDPASRWIPTRAGRNVAACLWALVALSYLRCYLSGHLKVDMVAFAFESDPYFQFAAAACLAFAGVEYLKVLEAAPRISLRRLLVGSLVLQAVAVLALPLTSNDLFSNLAYGELLHRGLSPYLHPPADLGSCDPFRVEVGVWVRTESVYGPAITALSGLTALGGLVASMVALKIAVALLGVGTVTLAYLFCRARVPSHRAARSFALLAWNPLFLWEVAGQAHNDVVLLLGLMAFAWAATARRPYLATASLAFAFLAKFAVIPVLFLYLFWQFRVRPARSAALALLFCALVAAGFAPYWHGPETLYPTLRVTGDDIEHVAHSVAEDCKMFGEWCGGRLGRSAAFWTFTLSMKVLLLTAALWFAHRVRTLSQVLRYSLAFLFAQECVGLVWFMPWYALWLLPLAVAVEDRRLQRAAAYYTILMSALYLPGCNVSDLSRLFVHLFPIWMLWRGGYVGGPRLPGRGRRTG